MQNDVCERKMTCVIMALDEDEMVSVRRCVQMGGGGDMIFPAELDKSLIAESLRDKLEPQTLQRLCDAWEKVLIHLKMHGGEAYVHAERIDISDPTKGTLVFPVARSAVL